MKIYRAILVIEDNDEDVLLIRRSLREYPGMTAGLDFVRKKTMAEAEEYFRTHKGDIELILLDLGLPDTKGGDDTFQRLEKLSPAVPVVILTGLEDHDLAIRLIGEGAENFVRKNIINERPGLLRDAIDFAISRHHTAAKTMAAIRKTLTEKEQVISWLTGSYSVPQAPSLLVSPKNE